MDKLAHFAREEKQKKESAKIRTQGYEIAKTFHLEKANLFTTKEKFTILRSYQLSDIEKLSLKHLVLHRPIYSPERAYYSLYGSITLEHQKRISYPSPMYHLVLHYRHLMLILIGSPVVVSFPKATKK